MLSIGSTLSARLEVNLNFLIREMTHVRYFVPIAQEGNRRGIKSNFCFVPSNKYNCPVKHLDVLTKIAEDNSIELFPLEGREPELKGYFFCSEDSGLEWTKRVKSLSDCKIIVSTYQTDFINCYEKYENVADHIMMPSKSIAEYYKLQGEKNLYVGIPKYDVSLDKNNIIKKYKLNPHKNKVLVLWPKSRDMHKFPIDIIQNFSELGWQVLVKSRAKDPLTENTKRYLQQNGHAYFYDGWYPHTSQELLEVSNLVVNCGSTTIEECVMHEVPLINFDIKPEVRHGIKQKYRVTHSYLYNYDFCMNLKSLDPSFNTSKLNEMTQYFLRKDFSDSFSQCKDDWLYNHKNTCKNLLDVILS